MKKLNTHPHYTGHKIGTSTVTTKVSLAVQLYQNGAYLRWLLINSGHLFIQGGTHISYHWLKDAREIRSATVE